MINIYSPKDIATIREGGKILGTIVQQVLAKVEPGITTLELDQFVDQEIAKSGGASSFKMQNGDRLGIDAGVFYKGFHTDASWSIVVEYQRSRIKDQNEIFKIKNFLATGERALREAIKKCVPGNHIGDISKTIQDIVEGGGYSCVKQLVGHGVGKMLHEDPEIPCYLRGKIEFTPEIEVGMVLAVEVIYNQGQSPVVYANDDGWTIVTRDGLPSGLFEQTVAVTKNGPEILTA